LIPWWPSVPSRLGAARANLVAWAMKLATRLLPAAASGKNTETDPTSGAPFDAPTSWLRGR
jgi:hypothetical protein